MPIGDIMLFFDLVRPSYWIIFQSFHLACLLAPLTFSGEGSFVLNPSVQMTFSLSLEVLATEPYGVGASASLEKMGYAHPDLYAYLYLWPAALSSASP